MKAIRRWPARDQMRGHREGAGMIVDREARMAAGIAAAAEQDERRPPAERRRQHALVRIRRHHHHRVDPAAHRAQHRRRLIGVAVGMGEQEMQAARAGREVDAADQLGEELAVQIGQDDADRVGAPGGERAGAAVRDIIELGGGGERRARASAPKPCLSC